jgi:hypothetical protein
MRRKGIFAAGVALAFAFLAATGPAAGSTPVSISRPVAGGGTDGFENCALGTYATNRSESALAVDRTGRLLGMSKYFFSSPYQGAVTDWSQVYRFQLGSYEGTTNQLLPGFDCISGPALGLPGWDANTDPNVAFDYAGNAYAASLPYNYDNLKNALAVSKKPVGSGWQRPVILKEFSGNGGLGREYDKQWITADWNAPCAPGQSAGCSPFSGYVYAAWTIFGLNTGKIYFSRSADGGTTWSPPRQIGQQSGPYATYVYLDVDNTGKLYIEYAAFGQKFAGSGQAQVLVSSDGGKSFAGPYAGPSFTGVPFVARTNDGWTLPNTTFRDGIIDYFAASHTNPGTLWIVAEQWDKNGCNASSDATGDYDVAVFRSTDGGRTWTSLGCVNDAATQGDSTDQFQPQVATDTQGHTAVTWYDRRNACPTTQPAPTYYTSPGASNYCIQVGLQWFRDGTGARAGGNEIIGPSWDPQQPANGPAPVGSPAGYISDLPHSVFNPCYSDGIPVCVTFIGDYFGLAVYNGTAYTLSVSTYPTVQNGQTVDAWSQAVGGSISPGSIAPAANDFYQQQVFASSTSP